MVSAAPGKSRLLNSPAARRSKLISTGDPWQSAFRPAKSLLRSSGSFAHPNFCAVALKRHLIHELINHINSTAMSGMEIFGSKWIGDSAEHESLARIPDHDHYVRR